MSFAQRRSGFFKSSLPGSLPSLGGYLDVTLGNVTASSAGTVDITGSLSKTLANVTSSATGALAITGVLSQALQDVTLSAAGTVGSGITGDLAVNLGNATLSSAGALAVAGATSSTLGNVTLSSGSTLALSGSLSATLGDVTTTSVSALAITGALSSTLAGATLIADGSGGILGQLSVTLGDVTLGAVSLLTGDVQQFSGGFVFAFERELARRQRDRKKLEEIERHAEQIEDAVDREIAQILHEEDSNSIEIVELDRLKLMVAQFADKQAQEAMSERVRKAFARAAAEQSAIALQILERELRKQFEEEEFMILTLLA